ncbi:hypothetical protein ACQKWADRAFT_284194 [Trichoderma austrokoningii]
MGVCSAICVIFITIIFPPLGVWAVAGCGMDLVVNTLLTLLGYLPGHIHAFYLEYVYYDRRHQAREGYAPPRHAPGIYSEKVQNGGQAFRPNYGTMAAAPPAAPTGPATIGGQPYECQAYGNQPYNQGYSNQGYGNPGYGNQGYNNHGYNRGQGNQHPGFI